jgi:hypothetical protein
MLSYIQILIGIFVLMPIITLIHELGHITFAKLFNIETRGITLGLGKTLFSLKSIEIKQLYFFFGYTKNDSISDKLLSQKILFYISGALFNLVSIIIIRLFPDFNLFNYYIITPFITFSEFCTLMSLIPIKYPDSRVSDGLQILTCLKDYIKKH